MNSRRNAKSMKDHLFLRSGLEELRIFAGDWKQLGDQVHISVPMLYAFQSANDPRSPTFETACDLGIRHAELKQIPELDSCKAWLKASGRELIPDDDLAKLISLRKA